MRLVRAIKASECPRQSPFLPGQDKDLLLLVRQDDLRVPEPYSALMCITA